VNVKMAPVYVACRLFLGVFVFVSFSVVRSNVMSQPAVLTYYRQTLINIKSSMGGLHTIIPGCDTHRPPFRCPFPKSLCRLYCLPYRRKRRRRRGIRGGLLVKLKASLKTQSVQPYSPLCDLIKKKAYFVAVRSMETPYQWITSVSDFVDQLPLRRPAVLRRWRVTSQNLRSLRRDLDVTEVSTELRFALINVRSLTNKTFILSDFFKTQSLDILCLTETWVNTGDVTPFSELLPPNCGFLNTPRSSGRGGGVASIFKKFNCRLLHNRVFTSFELQLF
jgi:hypothetical protein